MAYCPASSTAVTDLQIRQTLAYKKAALARLSFKAAQTKRVCLYCKSSYSANKCPNCGANEFSKEGA